jgi:geranylgeranyl reductase
MVDRGDFDEWLRARAAAAGAVRRTGVFARIERDADGAAVVCYREDGAKDDDAMRRVGARCVIGADGARSRLARQVMPGADKTPCVFAYHEIIRSPGPEHATAVADFDPARCDIFYQGQLSPDFYAWIFPHGETTSVGVGSAVKGFALRDAVRMTRRSAALQDCATLRTEGAPIPLRPLRRWDNGRDIVLAGDAAGVVAPASGEGIYYAMVGGRYAAQAVETCLATGNCRALAQARQRFMRAHGRVFLILRIMQHFWYRSDKRREGFVKMCADPDVQTLTWQAYMNKELVRADPGRHLRIFLKDMGHLLNLSTP